MALDVPYRSIPDMFRRRVAATPGPPGARLPDPGRAGRLADLEAGGRPGLRDRRGAGRARGAARGPGRDPLRYPAGMGPRRPRRHVRRGGDHDGVPDDRTRGRGLHRRRLRCDRAHRRGRRARWPRCPDGSTGAAARRGDRRRGPGRDHPGRAGARGAPSARRRPGHGRPDHRGDPARPARDAHLHVGHHRTPQGRRAAARRLVLGGRSPRPNTRRHGRGRPAVPVAAAVPLVRQDADLRDRSTPAYRPMWTVGSTGWSRSWLW